jgi:hypothetical protein
MVAALVATVREEHKANPGVAIALMITPNGPMGFESAISVTNPELRRLAIVALRLQVLQFNSSAVAVIAPEQPEVLDIYSEERSGQSWLGRACTVSEPDGTITVLDPVWSDGAASEFHPLLSFAMPDTGPEGAD